MRAYTIILGLTFTPLLAGCADHWIKAGATDADFEETRAACTAGAFAAYPPLLHQALLWPGHYVPIQTVCNSYGYSASCYQTGGEYVPPVMITLDANDGPRAAAKRGCFYRGGWTLDKS